MAYKSAAEQNEGVWIGAKDFTEGSSIEGILVGIIEEAGNFKRPAARIEVIEDGVPNIYKLNMNNVLEDQFSGIPIGSKVLVTYKGRFAGKRGGGAYDHWETLYDEDYVQAYLEKMGKTQAVTGGYKKPETNNQQSFQQGGGNSHQSSQPPKRFGAASPSSQNTVQPQQHSTSSAGVPSSDEDDLPF